MRRSLLKLFTSFYIIVVSVLLIVISAYAWVTISNSPEAGGIGFGVAGLDAWGLPEKDYSIWDGSTVELSAIERDENGIFLINSAAEFVTVMKLAEDGSVYPGDITMKLMVDISLADLAWTPVSVDGYNGTDVVTILGNEKEIVGLTAPLFAGGFAGESGIVIHDLTVADSRIISQNTQGSGAFIECVDSMETVVLDNCHLVDSSVTGSRTGGLIGWTSGYDVENDGPVDTHITVTDCSVINSTITGTGTVGGIIGQAGANPATYHTIENCTVSGTKLISTNTTDNKGVGTIVGTANVGEIFVIDCDISGVAESGHEADLPDLVYGRAVFGDTGSLVVIEDGTVTTYGNVGDTTFVADAADLTNALAVASDSTHSGDIEIYIISDIDMTGVAWEPVLLATENSTDTITIEGNGHSITNLSAPLLAGGVRSQQGCESLIIRDLTIADSNLVSTNALGNGAFIECVAGLQSVEIDNCHLVNSTITGVATEGTRTGGIIGWTSAGKDADNSSVNTYIVVNNSSVSGSELVGYGTVGGIMGHAGYNSCIYHTISNCVVTDTKLESTETPYKGVGTILGTANIGEVIIRDCESSRITEIVPTDCEADNELDLVYGRLALNETGKLTIISGTSITIHTPETASTEAAASETTEAESTTEAPSDETTVTDTATEAPAEETTEAESTTEAPSEEMTEADSTTEALAEETTEAESATDAPAEETTEAESTTEAPSEETTEADSTTESPAEETTEA